MDGNGGDPLHRQQDLEKTLISHNVQGIPSSSSSTGSRGFSYGVSELDSSKWAASSSAAPVESYNASLHATPVVQAAAEFAQTPFRNIPVVFAQIASGKKLYFSPNQFSVDGKVSMISNFSNKGANCPQSGLSASFLPNLNSFPEKAACKNMDEGACLPVAPPTPAKINEIQGAVHGELVDFMDEELNRKASNLETNMLQCSTENANNGPLKFLAPLTPDKEKRVQDCIPSQVINLFAEGSTNGGENNQDLGDQCSNSNSSMPTTTTKRSSSSQQGVEQHTQTWSDPSQQLESVKKEQRNYGGVSLNSTQRKKTRRKRYMPKVIREDKPTRTPKPVTPKPVTPKPVSKNENQTTKRSYVRKKKSLNSSDTSPNTIRETVGRPNAEGRSADPHVLNGFKPVRRRLNFGSEGGAVNVHLESSTTTNARPRGRRPRCTPTSSSRSKSMMQLRQGIDMAQNWPADMVLDFSRSLNQMLGNYAILPEGLKPLTQFSESDSLSHFASSVNCSISEPIPGLQPKLGTSQKKVNLNGLADLILLDNDNDKAGTKRDLSHIDSAQTGWTLSRDAHFIQTSMEINQASRCDETNSHVSYSQDMHKRRRTEKQDLEHKCSEDFASADTHMLLIPDKSQSPEHTLTLDHIKRPTKKRSKIPVRARKLTSIATIIDCNQPSPTPEKPPQARIEALFADNYMKMKRKGRAKKTRAHLVKLMSLNMDHGNKIDPCIYGSLDQKSVESTALGDFHEENFHHLQIIPIQQYPISNHIQEPPHTDSMPTATVPYVSNMNDVIWKTQELDIEGGQVGSAELQNALVPYGGTMMVPFEGPLDIIKKQRPRAKVELDDETERVWKLLMGKACSEPEGSDAEKEKWWEEERLVFHGRADSFIARMRLIQGDRSFSPWKGSVVDSVVGVFLTQNVSDQLSSSAFMAIAARFPLQSRSDNAEPNAENMSALTEKQDGSNHTSDATCWQERRFSPDGSHESIVSNVSGNKIDDSEDIGLHIHRKELEIGFETQHYRTDTLVAVTRSSESEERQSLEDIVSSQNSITSPGNSLDYLIQTTDLVGSSSGSNSGINPISGSALFGLGSSASLEENACIAETIQKQEMDNHCNGGVLLEENCSGYDEGCAEGENSTKITHGLNNLKGACGSISYSSNSHLKCSKHDTNVSSVPFALSHPDNLKFKSLGMENINVVREESIANLPFTASRAINTNNTKTVEGHCNLASENTTNSASEQSALLSKITEAVDSCACRSRYSSQSPTCSGADHYRANFHQDACRSRYLLQSPTCSRGDHYRTNFHQEDFQLENTQHVVDDQIQIPHIQVHQHQASLKSCNNARKDLLVPKTVEANSKDEFCISQNVPTEKAKSTLRVKKAKVKTEKAETFDWDSLRRQACSNGYQKETSNERMDSVDWEAVRCADVNEISEAIRERGMNNVLAGRIKDFLNRLVKDHGSIDLEWLRDIAPDKAKDYLLSIRGLGLKSVECVRLLTLHHLAFPVDTNVGRICVRLGWVPLQPLPESVQLHLLEQYPIMASIQKFLWPRLCKLDQETLYELHYQMITFGKVFCTKNKPNCNACPMRGECKHFASAFASARLALPGPEDKSIVSMTTPFASRNDKIHTSNPAFLPQLEKSNFSQCFTAYNGEPIIEEPPSPEPAQMENFETDIEDAFYEDPHVIPMVKLNEELTQNLQNYIQDIELKEGDMAKAIVAVTEKAASVPMPKLKNVSRLRTEHQVYVIPDLHPILEGLEQRQPDDPCPYLLTIWTPGETALSTEPPETCCNSQDTAVLCDDKTCFACSCRREEQAQTVRGTILIPCRTAMRGRFPLNGTYFQKNEVFADHVTSISPIHVPRKWIWNLPRRAVYFGTSVTSIFRGITAPEAQQCFRRGYICVRGFERETRAPRPLCARLHFAASKALTEKKTTVKVPKKLVKQKDGK